MSLATISSIQCPTFFDSSKDDVLTAQVIISNPSEFTHSAQVIFRGYVRKGNVLQYEFLHEQQWLLVPPNSEDSHRVIIDVWLPRFPPTMSLPDGTQIEYSVRASINPWFDNNFVEQFFEVRRFLTLKMPHVACYSIENSVNKCCEHGSLLHKKCDPINGSIYFEKRAYCPGEQIQVDWNLKTEKIPFESISMKLVQYTEIRISEPGHQMLTKKFEKVLCEEKTKSTSAAITVPTNCHVSVPMSLWDVLMIRYEVELEIKLQKRNNKVKFNYPIIVCNEEVAKRKKPETKTKVFERIQDVDDDSADDDDYDSDDEENENPGGTQNREFSVDIEKLNVTGQIDNGNKKPLEHAAVDVTFSINSFQPQSLRHLRLLLSGEARVGSNWYEFVRFKAIANSSSTTQFSPGQHLLHFILPFGESQYDTTILPPSIGDEIRYTVRATTTSMRKNLWSKQCELIIDRFVDTWAKESFKTAYFQEYGATTISMSQRCFKRGKRIIILVEGENIKKIEGKLIQNERLRIPGFDKDDSYVTERNVSIFEEDEEEIIQRKHVHIMQIPFNIPPSIEISYWNVVQIKYRYDINITIGEGHKHTHQIPIWIGCTEDYLEPPQINDQRNSIKPVDMVIKEPYEELPEFEIVHREDVREQPYWVERINTDTYK